MKRLVALALLGASVAGCSDSFTAPADGGKLAPAPTTFSRISSQKIAGSYIVVFKNTVTDVDAAAHSIVARHGGRIRHTYKSALRGFALDLSDSAAAALRAEPNVAYVEQDQTISISASFNSPLVSAASGQCLDTQGGSATAGTPATVAACSGSTSQALNLPAVGTAGQVLMFSGSMCLDDFGAAGRVGDVVGVYRCVSGASTQSWTLTSAGALTGVNGLCVAVSGGSVTLQTCNGSAGQQWSASAGPAPAPAPAPAPGTRFTSTLVSAASSQCLGTQGGSSTDATPATLAPCSGSTDQSFSISGVGTAGQVLMFGGTKCLDDFGAAGRVGDVVGVYRCVSGAPSQSWTLNSAGALVGINGLCVGSSGTSITLQTCNGSASQQWTTGAATPAPAPAPAPTPAPSTRFTSTLTNVASSQCLGTQGGSSADATPATLAACSGSTDQAFSIPGVGTAGQVLMFSGTKCLDDFGAAGRVGDVVGVYHCVSGAPSQSWTLNSAGALVGINGLCVGSSGTSITLQSCTGSANQHWTTGSQPAPAPAPAPAPSPSTITQTGADWGLDRMDQRALPLNGSFTYDADGTGVTVYIIDTGINFTHNEFGGRAVTGVDEITSGGTAADCNGHGTHVAGTVGGATYGVAKNVRLVAVRVLDCSGSGTSSGVIAGIDWVTANHAASSVANLSLGGTFSQALNDAVERSISAGVVFAVAAGNSTADACTTSPASAPDALTTGATGSDDSFASFSNYGTCVKINAPGVNITSAWIGSNTATAAASGTSMASPHVAGAAAVYLQKHPGATPSQVRTGLVGNATSNVITSIGTGTPNLLLYSATGTTP